ncbi:MAG: asparagine synthase (glutamine-hydrolyzing) [Rhizobiaceae bacterium]|nr:asparagine synthase (glutamine-hydrolyzing) [Rhizobiaceae bacterium]
MCGILGAVPAVPAELFDRALATLAHRGPDGPGSWRDGDAAVLGHQRLAIIDPSHDADQPMHYAGRYHLIFNGEIYNFLEVGRTLEELGHSFKTKSDTEVLLAAFSQWGEGCLTRLNGMFAFAIWDSEDRTVFVARDRMGEKPFFHIADQNRFIFASEQKALLPFLDRVQPAADFADLVRNPYAYEGTEHCLFAGLKRLPAGHCGWYRNGRLEAKRYWSPLEDAAKAPEAYDEQVEALRALLLDSTRMRMRADVPIGTALSGGVDSSAVAACIAETGGGGERISENWQNAFVSSFPDTVMDEAAHARKVAEHLHIPLTEVVIDPSVSADQIERNAWLFEEVHEVNPLPHIALYKAMRDKGVLVSLDGHAGDELFGGYESSLLQALPDALPDLGAAREVLDTYRRIHPENEQFRGMSLPHIVAHLARSRLRDVIGQGPDLPRPRPTESLNRHLFGLTFGTVLPTLLRNYDHYSMINGVEVRIPLLDHRIVEFAFAIPWQSKIRNGYSKSVLRDAVAPFLPDDIVHRRQKLGFAPPIIDWMRGPLKPYLLDTIASSSFKTASLISPQELAEGIRAVTSGQGPSTLYAAERVWKQFGIYLWEKAFLGAQTAAPAAMRAAG